MKTLFNLSTSPHDLGRFEGREELLALMEGFDGLELLWAGEDDRGLLSRETVIGLHLNCPPAWLDFWRGCEENLRSEFGDRETWEAYYGGAGKEALLAHYRQELARARKWGAEYVVFHLSDTLTEDFFTQNYRHRDKEVIDAAAELLNELFAAEDGSLALLMENLWHPGLRFTDPRLTARLLERVHYPNKGLMLDTGHLMHTNPALQTQAEALSYIHHLLDIHGDLCRHIRGVHLHQSLTGDYTEAVRKSPPKLADSWAERQTQAYYHAFAADRHEPFAAPGVAELMARINPEYLTFEFITESLAQHRRFLKAQRAALGLK